MSMKIGIMGGTFDPIHLGHLIAAEQALIQVELDEVRFMPTYVPPHKAHSPFASSEERWDMVCLAIADHPSFVAERLELDREGTSYTIDTIREMKSLRPDAEFYFIIGGDMVQYLPRWSRIEELSKLIRFIGLERPGYPIELSELPEFLIGRVVPVSMPLVDISSTDIRSRLANRVSARYLIPNQVLSYIEENRLYAANQS
jgi:nicotinate-nucleotide adenylyltransferase